MNLWDLIVSKKNGIFCNQFASYLALSPFHFEARFQFKLQNVSSKLDELYFFANHMRCMCNRFLHTKSMKKELASQFSLKKRWHCNFSYLTSHANSKCALAIFQFLIWISIVLNIRQYFAIQSWKMMEIRRNLYMGQDCLIFQRAWLMIMSDRGWNRWASFTMCHMPHKKKREDEREP